MPFGRAGRSLPFMETALLFASLASFGALILAWVSLPSSAAKEAAPRRTAEVPARGVAQAA